MNTRLTLLIPFLFIALAACEDQGPLEEAGERADAAMNDMRDQIDDAGDQLREGADDAADKVEEGLEEAADKVDENH